MPTQDDAAQRNYINAPLFFIHVGSTRVSAARAFPDRGRCVADRARDGVSSSL